ncbi:hypothetical protein ACOL21_07505 [Aliarcobacter butzleri]|uniref:hypothetical protein n=1 Tax=Aliarcobacter butzleri TaxID=28197 RepID=UPI00263D3467|nr:hypothetical protein [Aliarcobacter butzleri]MDN5086598.1 hypothetical protein [Aliarcobacter butzleri]
MIDYLYLLFIFIFAFIFRSILRVFFKKDIDFDTYFHLYFIEFIRNNGTKNLIEQKRFIKPFGLNYPWMMHFFISLFPKKFDMLFERFFNPLLDSVFTISLYIVTFYITESNNQALILVILYLFTPAMFTTLSLGPRIKSFTPRLFGEIVGGMMFIFEYLYFINDNYIYLLLAILFSGLAYLSSKFSVQAIVFISIFLFLFTFDTEYLVVLIGGFILSMILSRGKYIEVLKQQVEHLKWYFIRNIQGKMSVSNRNSLKILVEYLKNKRYKKIISTLLFDNTFIIILTRFPLVYLALYFIYEGYITNEKLELVDYFIISSFILFFISSLKWFLFIGEAERYINYMVFFILLKVTLFFEENMFYLVTFIMYGFIFYILDFILLKKNKLNQSNIDDELILWLNNQEKELKIATIPYHLGGWKLTYETKHDWLYHLVWLNLKEKNFLDSNYTKKYPFLDIYKADKIIDEYNLDYIFYNKQALDKNYGEKYEIPTNLKQIQISENVFALYK